MYRIEVIGEVKDGKFRLTNPKREQVNNELSFFPNCRAVMTIKKLYRQRTLPQNAYIHAYLIPEVSRGLIANGWSAQEINEDVTKIFLKNLFLKRELVNEQTGETITVIKDTSELTTLEMSEFIESVIQWAAENLHIEILYPGEQSDLDFDRVSENP